ncbi:MAG: sporulation protein YabP [bacterium]|nr:sporulation protein YabP [bacterium]
MEKQDTINTYSHGVSLVERKNLMITGVKKVENFDTEQFLIETSMGFILVKGQELELIKLDTVQGNVSIRGIINGINYLEDNAKKSKESSLFNKLFK